MVDRSDDAIALDVRRAIRADVPAIVRLLADDALGQQRERDVDPLPAMYYTAFDAINDDPRHELVVVEAQRSVVGTLQLSFLPSLSHQGGWRAQIEAVRVDRRYRNHGVGQHLLTWAIDRARQQQCQIVQLTTHANRGDAQRFYERLGFVASHVGMKLELRPLVSDSE